MNDSQSNRLDMYLVVSDFYAENQPVIDTVPALATALGQLNTNIAAINAEVAGQSTNTTGVAQDKTALRNTLDNAALSVMQPAKAWALSVGNNTLAVEFDYSLTDLQRIKDDTMEGFCTYRIGLVNDNLASMADFGVLPANVAEWQSALDAYIAAVASPREAVNTRHLHTENLKTLFSETGQLFVSQLDPLMVPFKTTDPSLYNGYKQARIVINRKGRSGGTEPGIDPAAVFGVVTDEMGGFVIANAIVNLSDPSLETMTSEDGTYEIKDVPQGEYNLHVEATNYEPYDQMVLVEESAQVEVNVQLMPLPPEP